MTPEHEHRFVLTGHRTHYHYTCRDCDAIIIDDRCDGQCMPEYKTKLVWILPDVVEAER